MENHPPLVPTRAGLLLIRVGLSGILPRAVAREGRLRLLTAAVAVAGLHDGDTSPGAPARHARAARVVEKRMRAVKKHGDLQTEQDWEDYLARLDGATKVSRMLSDFVYKEVLPPREERP